MTRRVTKRQLEMMADFIHSETTHSIGLLFTQGCGTYLTIDEHDYRKTMKDGSGIGLANKDIYKLLKPYWNEAFENFKKAHPQYSNAECMD